MKKRIFILFSIFWGCLFLLDAATIDTVQTWSTAMNKTIPALVVTPDGYSTNKSYPVVYMLHGYSGS